MKTLSLLLSIGMVFFSCENQRAVESKTTVEPLFNVSSCSSGVILLCETFTKLSDKQLSDEEYKQLQIQVEAIYLGLEFGVNAGFYTHEDILKVADSLGCVM